MEVQEFGKENSRKIVLVPGNMMCWKQFENMKKAIQKLKRAFPNAEFHPFPGFGHGEIIAYPELMTEEIKRFVGGYKP